MKSRLSLTVAGLFCGLTLCAAVTASTGGQQLSATLAATGRPASEALQGRVRVHLEGTLEEGGLVGRGRFTLSGVLSDRGRFVDYVGRSGSGLSIRRVLFGAKGTIRVLVTVHADLLEPTTWRITEGSEAFAGLRGKGKEAGGVEAGRINITMRGTVSQ